MSLVPLSLNAIEQHLILQYYHRSENQQVQNIFFSVLIYSVLNSNICLRSEQDITGLGVLPLNIFQVLLNVIFSHAYELRICN